MADHALEGDRILDRSGPHHRHYPVPPPFPPKDPTIVLDYDILLPRFSSVIVLLLVVDRYLMLFDSP